MSFQISSNHSNQSMALFEDGLDKAPFNDTLSSGGSPFDSPPPQVA